MAEIITQLDTVYGRIRLLIGDTEQGNGILPGNRNFLDAEIQTFYEMEGEGITDQGKAIGRAAAAALESAATAWAASPFEEMLGPHRQKQRSSDLLNKRAAQLRKRYGSAVEPDAYQGRLTIKRAIEYE